MLVSGTPSQQYLLIIKLMFPHALIMHKMFVTGPFAFTSTLSNNICARYILIKLMLPFGHVSGTSFMCLGFERIKAEPV